MGTKLGWAIGVATFVSINVAGAYITGPAHCRDGWPSPSIGHRGACSHHGGVSRSGEAFLYLGFVLGGIVGAAVGTTPTVGGEKRGPPPTGEESPARSARPDPLVVRRLADGEPECPMCGGTMKQRMARRGRNKGKHFFGCARYPYCTGTRKIETIEPRATERFNDNKER